MSRRSIDSAVANESSRQLRQRRQKANNDFEDIGITKRRSFSKPFLQDMPNHHSPTGKKLMSNTHTLFKQSAKNKRAESLNLEVYIKNWPPKKKSTQKFTLNQTTNRVPSIAHIFDFTRFSFRPSIFWDIGNLQEQRNKRRKNTMISSGSQIFTQAALAGLYTPPILESKSIEQYIGKNNLNKNEAAEQASSAVSTVATMDDIPEENFEGSNGILDEKVESLTIEEVCRLISAEDLAEVFETLMAPDPFIKSNTMKNVESSRKKTFESLGKALMSTCIYNAKVKYQVDVLPSEKSEEKKLLHLSMSVDQVRALKSKPSYHHLTARFSTEFLTRQINLDWKGANPQLTNPGRTLRKRGDRSHYLSYLYETSDDTNSDSEEEDEGILLRNLAEEVTPKEVGASDHQKQETRASSNAYYKRAGRPKVNRAGCKCLLCGTVQTPQWRFMTVFDDAWMDLVCNACYMKFNGCRPYYCRNNRAPPPIPEITMIKKPQRPSLAEYKAKGPCAFPHLMRRTESKQFSIVKKNALEEGDSSEGDCGTIRGLTETLEPTSDSSLITSRHRKGRLHTSEGAITNKRLCKNSQWTFLSSADHSSEVICTPKRSQHYGPVIPQSGPIISTTESHSSQSSLILAAAYDELQNKSRETSGGISQSTPVDDTSVMDCALLCNTDALAPAAMQTRKRTAATRHDLAARRPAVVQVGAPVA